MLHGSFTNPSTHASLGQAPPSSSDDMKETNVINNDPPSNFEFQYEFSQPASQYPVYASPQVPSVAPNIQSAFRVQHSLETPVVSRNASQAYRGAPSRGNIPNHTTSTSSSWEGGSHPAIPYAQQAQMNIHRGQAGEAGASFPVNPQNMMATSFPVPPPPGGYAAPNAAPGMYAALWQLHDIKVEPEGTECLRLVIELKRLPTQSV